MPWTSWKFARGVYCVISASLVDLNEVARSGMGLLTAHYRSQGLAFENELAPHSIPVRVNPFSIEEVIVNLLNNARDAVEKRNQEEATPYTPCIRITSGCGRKNAQDAAWLAVKDNGMGISRSIADKVFDPFFTTKDPDKGTGLGLAICRSIVEEFGGNIQFTSKEAEGTIFTIDFPAHLNCEVDTHEYIQRIKRTDSR